MKKIVNYDLRKVPSVDKILRSHWIQIFFQKIDAQHITEVVRQKIEKFKKRIVLGEELSINHLQEMIIEELKMIERPSYGHAINGLGIVLHTGLGRAPLCDEVVNALISVSKGYCRLEIDDEGKRGERNLGVQNFFRILTGCEDALVVNNNAAATFLILNTIAKGKEAIISRGQLVEIGGSFRLPEIMAQSGTTIHEIGTTNRTYLSDYESAINNETAAILCVHQSNYRIVGYVNNVPLEELVRLGKRYNLPVIHDLGSGAFIDLSKYGLPKEPVVQESIKKGGRYCLLQRRQTIRRTTVRHNFGQKGIYPEN